MRSRPTGRISRIGIGEVLDHAPDAAHVLGQQARGSPATGRLDISPEVHDPVGNSGRDIEAFQPGVVAEPGKNAAADRVVAGGQVVLSCREDGLEKIPATDDADQFAVAQNGKALDAAFVHDPRRARHRRILIDADGVGRHRVPHPPGAPLHIGCRNFVRSEPCIGLRRGGPAAQLRPPDQVALADDADQLSLVVDDRNAADIIVEHHTGCLSDAVVRRYAHDPCRHYVLDVHARYSGMIP